MTAAVRLGSHAPQVVIRGGAVAEHVAEQIARRPLPLVLPPWDHGRRPTVVLFDSAAHEELDSILEEPAVAAIDLGCADAIGGLGGHPAALLLRVSTAAAMRLDVAGPVAQALCRRHPKARPAEMALHTALQEAIGNAVMHGNLGLDSGLRASREGLAKFARMMQERAESPLFGRRPVTIAARWDHHALVVTVEDRGHGFDRHAVAPVPHGTSGRGLALIRAACHRATFSSKGQRISMHFRLS